MDTKYRKWYFSVERKGYVTAMEIIDQYRIHSDVEDVNGGYIGGDACMIGLRCDSDDLESIQQDIRNRGFKVW